MKSKQRTSGAFKAAALGTAVAVGMVIASIGNVANASEFGVQVVDEAGLPVSGASVCFGLPGSYHQFGAHFTDEDGRAMADVPNIPFVVTVSKTRFSGVRLSEPARGFNLIKQVTLAEGTPGPRCKAGSTLADSGESSIRLSKVDVRTSNQATIITPVATGDPTEYRIGDTPNLENQTWTELFDSIRLTGSIADKNELFLQLRRYEGTSTGWVEAHSDVVTVFVPRPISPL